LAHPNIVRALDAGEVDGVVYIAFELIDGGTLAKLITERSAFPLSVALDVGIQVSRALEYAHALTGEDGKPLNLVHRDVSPENVLISSLGHAKLIDFGIARHSDRRFETQTGIIKGKITYMAPELLELGPADSRSDIFSLGLMIVEMILGKPVIPKAPVGVLAIPNLPARLRSELSALNAPGSLIELLVSMTDLDRKRRPESVLHVKTRLADLRRTLKDELDLKSWIRGSEVGTEDLLPGGSGLMAPAWPARIGPDVTAAPMTIELSEELSEEEQRADTIPPDAPYVRK